MNPSDELQFIAQLPLRNFKKTLRGYNFSCPLCGEGNSPHKHRAWILFAGGGYGFNTFSCFNCGETTNIEGLLRKVNEAVHKEYLKEKRASMITSMREGTFNHKIDDIRPVVKETGMKLFTPSPLTFCPVTKYKRSMEYIQKRKIPERHFDQIIFCPKKNCNYSEMVVFPFWKDRLAYGLQGRTITGKRFRTFSVNEGMKVYNLFNVDTNKKVYVFESIIDSLFVQNSIAMVGADLSAKAQMMLNGNEIYCFDSDITGLQKSIKYLETGKRVFYMPNEMEGIKDINQAILEGYSEMDIMKIINSNTVSGISGVIKFKLKLKNKKR